MRHIWKAAGVEFVTSTARTRIYGEHGGEPLIFDHQTKWHELRYEGGVWMTDFPVEQAQLDELLSEVNEGSVLIGGLGLGYAVNVLARRSRIDRICVVESAPEVVQLVGPYIKDADRKVELIQQDVFDFLRGCTETFDWGFYDIWQSDSEETFFEYVVPLRELSASVIPPRFTLKDGESVNNILCWNEDVMRGQLYSTLMGRYKRNAFSALDTPPTHEEFATPKPEEDDSAMYHNWSVPFFQAVINGNIDDDNVEDFSSFYVSIFCAFPDWLDEFNDPPF